MNVVETTVEMLKRLEDHSLIARAMVSGVMRWELFRDSLTAGEICVGGMRYCTDLDCFNVPRLNDNIRAALHRAVGEIK